MGFHASLPCGKALYPYLDELGIRVIFYNRGISHKILHILKTRSKQVIHMFYPILQLDLLCKLNNKIFNLRFLCRETHD